VIRFLPQVARVDEALCIGCAKCLPACPVDAILGAARQMHTVIADLCIGCEQCLPPCPMDCIRMVEVDRHWTEAEKEMAYRREEARDARLSRQQSDGGRVKCTGPDNLVADTTPNDKAEMQAYIQAAIERTHQKRAKRLPSLPTSS
jgi:electron transport complex protein RnfB